MDLVAETPAGLETPGVERPGENRLHVLAQLLRAPGRTEDGIHRGVGEDKAVALPGSHRLREAARGERFQEEAPAGGRVGENRGLVVPQGVEDLPLDPAVSCVVAEHEDVGADLPGHRGREQAVVARESDGPRLPLVLQLLEGVPRPEPEAPPGPQPAEDADVQVVYPYSSRGLLKA